MNEHQVCGSCGIPKLTSEFRNGKNRCKKCIAEARHRWYLANRERVLAMEHARQINNATDISAQRHQYYERNRLTILAATQQRYQLNNETIRARVVCWQKSPRGKACAAERRKLRRQQVLSHYSRGKIICECCTEPDYQVLTIDHINGGGRAETMKLRASGSSFYGHLIKAEFPSGYQVLCMNCNLGKYRNRGICPHHSINILPQNANKRNRAKLVAETLSHYSDGRMCCIRCDETNPLFLTLDHINGGGCIERTKLGGGSIGLFRQLRQSGFPNGFQVLCMNCNWRKYRSES